MDDGAKVMIALIISAFLFGAVALYMDYNKDIQLSKAGLEQKIEGNRVIWVKPKIDKVEK